MADTPALLLLRSRLNEDLHDPDAHTPHRPAHGRTASPHPAAPITSGESKGEIADRIERQSPHDDHSLRLM
ncbi:hypothetical protein [Streptomyces sp. NBC_01197]|uniref:hypothetical protein n=1 Tax=Streptomyces sp. NBC_01197 TaxID=2903768 RepID=UPI002E0EF8EB|nr:hypothetical protein OG452_16325 [Streptomyces sp. NBC_01197]